MPIGKQRIQRIIDNKPPIKGNGGGIPTDAAPQAAPPTPGTPPPPDNLALTSGLTIADRSATAFVSATWTQPLGVDPQGYTIQWATDSGFTANVGGFDVAQPLPGETLGTTIQGLKPNTTYYVHVLTRYGQRVSAWGAAASTTTPQDTTPPSQPTSVAATFNNAGDFVLSGTAPSEANTGFIEATIKDTAAGTTYVTLKIAVQPGQAFTMIWPAAENVRLAAGDPTLTASVRSQSWAGYYSGATNYSATKAAPSAPTITVDFSGIDCVFTITPPADAVNISFVADTSVTARLIGRVGRYAYVFDQNRLDHSGTPDPSLAYSFTAIDGLGQASTAATGTATNAVPSAPSAVALVQLFSGFRTDVTATPPSDFATYRYRIIQTSPAASDVTVDDAGTSLARDVTVAATYQVGVKVVDLFGQASTETLSSTLVVDAFAIAYLRENLNYNDSLTTTPATLKAAMADDVRTTGGVSYASNASWVRWIQADWQLLYRIKTLIISMTPTSGTTNWYVRLSKDGTTWSYFSGSVVATGATGQSTTLTSRADASTAQTNAVASSTLGNSTSNRVDLPSVVEARYIELWIRNTAASTRVDEFFPRRLVQTDDMEAENVRAINIAAGAVTVDKLTIPGTASIDASLQLIAFRVPVSLDTGSGIYQGSGTFTSPTTGLKLYNSGGVGRLAGYNAGTEQVALDTDGRFKAGAGKVQLDATGIQIDASGTTVTTQTTLTFMGSGSTSAGELYGYKAGSGGTARRGMGFDVYGRTDTDAELTLSTNQTNGGSGRAEIFISTKTNRQIAFGIDNTVIAGVTSGGLNTSNLNVGGYIDVTEIAAPAGPAATAARIYANDTSGSTSLIVKYNNNTATGFSDKGRLIVSAATGSDNTSTSATAGGASGLPGLPVGYLTVEINGTARKIPYYA